MSEETDGGPRKSGRSTVIVCAIVGAIFALVLPMMIARPRSVYSYFGGWSVPLAITLCICSLIAFLLAVISLRSCIKHRLQRRWYLPGLVLFGVALIWPATSLDRIVLQALRERAELRGKTETFNGSSKNLRHTVIVPTLDTPIAANKNVIWCSSFQIAWNGMAESVVHGPIQVLGAEEIAERLNNAPASKNDIEQDDYFAAADWVSSGIVERIQDGMKEKFAEEPVPQFDPMPDDWAVAFAYLQAMIKFTHPFGKIERIHFVDSKGNRTVVKGFGCKSSNRSYEKARKQVEVLYYGEEFKKEGGTWKTTVTGFAVDLCKESRPYQIVLPSIEPKATLEETLSNLKIKIEEYHATPEGSDISYEPSISFVEPFTVPEMFWKIDHHFKELEGMDKIVVGIGPIMEASQIVHFRLDRFGAMLKSEARLLVGGSGRSFVFDKPFLLYMQKRGGERPFLVMWVDNAELLTIAEPDN